MSVSSGGKAAVLHYHTLFVHTRVSMYLVCTYMCTIHVYLCTLYVHTCVYMYIQVYIYVPCMYIHVYLSTLYVHTRVTKYLVCTYTCIYVPCMYIHVYLCTLYVHIRVSMYLHACVRVHESVGSHVYIRVRVCIKALPRVCVLRPYLECVVTMVSACTARARVCDAGSTTCVHLCTALM